MSGCGNANCTCGANCSCNGCSCGNKKCMDDMVLTYSENDCKCDKCSCNGDCGSGCPCTVSCCSK